MITKKDIQYVYDVISKSPDIQKLIKDIANSDRKVHDVCDYRNNDNEKDILKTQISDLKNELQNANVELDQYKLYYNSTKSKVEEYDSLKNEVSSLQDKVKTCNSELEQKKSETVELKKHINYLEAEKSEMEEELESANEIMRTLKKQFGTPVKYLEKYRSLSYSVRDGLENVISDKNIITFIASCSNENNLSYIWEYTKELSSDSDSADFQTLNMIFDYFFDVFNDSLPESKFVRDDVETGDELDDDYHERCFGSATSREITSVLLRGYKSKTTGKIIHKSLVKA